MDEGLKKVDDNIKCIL